MARVLLTGGTGYIGGMVARKLQGHTVFNIDRKLEDTGVNMATYNIDLSSPAMPDIVRAIRPDTIMHFAAETEVGKSMEQPGVFYETNVSNTIRLMNVAADVGVKNFIFSSTSSVYGDIPEFPPTEDVNKNPVSPYGISKSCIEDMLPDYESSSNESIDLNDEDFINFSNKFLSIFGFSLSILALGNFGIGQQPLLEACLIF